MTALPPPSSGNPCTFFLLYCFSMRLLSCCWFFLMCMSALVQGSHQRQGCLGWRGQYGWHWGSWVHRPSGHRWDLEIAPFFIHYVHVVSDVRTKPAHPVAVSQIFFFSSVKSHYWGSLESLFLAPCASTSSCMWKGLSQAMNRNGCSFFFPLLPFFFSSLFEIGIEVQWERAKG